MNKKLLFIGVLTTIVSSYTKTENKFDPHVTKAFFFNITMHKNKNGDRRWKEVCEQMINWLEQSKKSGKIKGQGSIQAFNTNEIKKENQHEGEDTTKDKKTFKPEEYNLVLMNVIIVKTNLTITNWKKVHKDTMEFQEKLKGLLGDTQASPPKFWYKNYCFLP